MPTIRVEGLDKLERNLQLIRDRSQANRIERFLLEGARDVADEVRPNAPVGRTGNLRRAIRAFKGKRAGKYIGNAIGWIDKRIARHLHLVAFGTKPHKIGGGVKFGDGQVRKAVDHPGAKPNDFFSDTVNRIGPRIADDVARKIGDYISGVSN